MAASRVRIFIDFWNLQLQWNDYHKQQGTSDVVRIPWKGILPLTLIQAIARGTPAKYVGAHVYASVDPGNPTDAGLRRFLHVLDSFPGYHVTTKNRKPASPPKCTNPDCRQVIVTCPVCNQRIRRTVEKGIDAAILTDLIQCAFDDTFDQAILVSGDADYVPTVQYIQRKTDKQVVQAFFRNCGTQLRNACWDHIYFEDVMPKLLVADT